MNRLCLINGTPGDAVAADDRGLHYGDGLFETIAVHEGRCEFWDRHLQRLLQGCERLRIPPPPLGVLRAEAEALVKGVHRVVLKIILTRGCGGRGYRPPVPAQPTRILMTAPWPDYPPEFAEEGVVVRLCAQRLGDNPSLAGIKHLNRLEQVLARSEWDGSAFVEGLMLDQQGQVVEGTFTNLFMVREQCLTTPPVDRCGIAGVVRAVVKDLAAGLGITCREARFDAGALASAEELFLTNSLIGIWPVRSLGQWKAKPGPVTRRLQKSFAESRQGRVTEVLHE